MITFDNQEIIHNHTIWRNSLLECQDPFNFGNLFLVVTLRFPEVRVAALIKMHSSTSHSITYNHHFSGKSILKGSLVRIRYCFLGAKVMPEATGAALKSTLGIEEHLEHLNA